MSVPYAPARWPAASATLGLWALAAASVVFWGLRLSGSDDRLAPPAVAAPSVSAIDSAAVAQLFGVLPAQAVVKNVPDAASRFALMGVVANTAQRGAALIAIDGKPARPFRVGMAVGDGYVLQSVGTRQATLGASVDSAPAFTLQLPTRPLAVMTPPSPLPAAPR